MSRIGRKEAMDVFEIRELLDSFAAAQAARTATPDDLGAIGHHDRSIITLWFTHDGRTLCRLDHNGTLKLWMGGDKPRCLP